MNFRVGQGGSSFGVGFNQPQNRFDAASLTQQPQAQPFARTAAPVNVDPRIRLALQNAGMNPAQVMQQMAGVNSAGEAAKIASGLPLIPKDVKNLAFAAYQSSGMSRSDASKMVDGLWQQAYREGKVGSA